MPMTAGQSSAGTVAQCAKEPEALPEKAKILLVDDQPANLVALESVLDDLGQDLVLATSGEEALRHLLSSDFAVILLDVTMPGMDGFETAALIRERERSRHTPIIFITAHEGDAYVFRGYQSGAVDFISKPIHPDVLRCKVAAFVELSRKTEELRRHGEVLKKRNAELERAIEERQKAENQVRLLNVELEQRVRERTADLQRANEELREFGFAASHDLREPLRTVNSYAQLLKRRFENTLDDEGKEFLSYIVDSVHRMDVLLNDLLAYSQQLNSAKEVLSLLDTEAVLAGVLMNLDGTIRETGAEVTNDPLPRVMSDFAQLARVFQNLICNAIKYRSEKNPRIHISAIEHDNEWLFSFADNGIGIDPRYHKQIFGIFKRLHGRQYPGTGIGLALVKRIIDRQGGRIWVESEAGQGATFLFTLPK